MRRTLILGLGNVLLKDEGAGVAAVNRLKDRYAFSDEVEIIDGGTLGLDLLHLVSGRDNVLIVDAVDFGKEPGYVGLMEGDEIPQTIHRKLSAHNVGLSDLLAALRLVGIMPLKLCLIGIQPEALTPGVELSNTIERQMKTLLRKVENKLKEWNETCVLQSRQKS